MKTNKKAKKEVKKAQVKKSATKKVDTGCGSCCSGCGGGGIKSVAALLVGMGLALVVFGAARATLAAQTSGVPVLASEFLQPAQITTNTYANNVVWKNSATVEKTLVIGTSKNKGVLYVKGYLKNPNKNKSLVVKDNMKVYGNLTVTGKILGTTILGTNALDEGAVTAAKLGAAAVTTSKLYDAAVTTDKLGADSVTSAKIYDGTIVAADLADSAVTGAKIAASTITSSDIDFTTDGVVKAAAYVLDGGEVSRQFNKLSTSEPTITIDNTDTGTFTVNFHVDVSARYFQITPVKSSTALHTVIATAPSSDSITVNFYTTDEENQSVDPTGFFITVY